MTGWMKSRSEPILPERRCRPCKPLKRSPNGQLFSQPLHCCRKTEEPGFAIHCRYLRSHKSKITQANAEDIRAGQKAGLRASLLDRLLLTDERVEAMACAVEDVIRLPDPVGRVLSGETMKDGMKLLNIRVPLGVCGIIYEARPNVTVDAASLCLKAGNVSVLKGGKEAIRSNTLCMDLMRSAIEKPVCRRMPCS